MEARTSSLLDAAAILPCTLRFQSCVAFQLGLPGMQAKFRNAEPWPPVLWAKALSLVRSVATISLSVPLGLDYDVHLRASPLTPSMKTPIPIFIKNPQEHST